MKPLFFLGIVLWNVILTVCLSANQIPAGFSHKSWSNRLSSLPRNRSHIDNKWQKFFNFFPKVKPLASWLRYDVCIHFTCTSSPIIYINVVNSMYGSVSVYYVDWLVPFSMFIRSCHRSKCDLMYKCCFPICHLISKITHVHFIFILEFSSKMIWNATVLILFFSSQSSDSISNFPPSSIYFNVLFSTFFIYFEFFVLLPSSVVLCLETTI